MQNTEGGRKLNQAMVSTGRAVATTGRAVGEYKYEMKRDYFLSFLCSTLLGGAFSHAKGALSSWWSNLLVSPDNRPAICEAEDALTVVDKMNSQSCQDIVKKGAIDVENNKKNNSEQDIPQSCELNKNNLIPNGDVLKDKKEEGKENDALNEQNGVQTV